MSVANLPDVEAESIFDVTSAMEAAFHQCLNPLLACGTFERGDKCVPFGFDFHIGWKARDIYKPFRFRDRLLVERGNPPRERIDKAIERRIQN